MFSWWEPNFTIKVAIKNVPSCFFFLFFFFFHFKFKVKDYAYLYWFLVCIRCCLAVGISTSQLPWPVQKKDLSCHMVNSPMCKAKIFLQHICLPQEPAPEIRQNWSKHTARWSVSALSLVFSRFVSENFFFQIMFTTYNSNVPHGCTYLHLHLAFAYTGQVHQTSNWGYFSYFPQTIGSDILCKFAQNVKANSLGNIIIITCRLLEFLPGILSIKTC